MFTAKIFYDSDCLSCDNFIKFVHKRDNGKFHFYSQKGHTFLEQFPHADHTTIIVYDQINQKVYKKASAIGYILLNLNASYGLLGKIILLIPPFISNTFYDVYATYFRKKKTDFCDISEKLDRVFID
ncbi:MAG TPA: DCC1-like thiol-disulfide oxidoreductase family protein [Saprospiraceae bacterium]|nr:DCC1-like thiol-disulfide oxidoreductase family protein [Saprospiraceae bacterium]